MQPNVGNLDRVLRVVLGAVLIVWVALLGGPAWAWIGVVPLVTGLIRICPVYSVIGLNTCPAKEQK